MSDDRSISTGDGDGDGDDDGDDDGDGDGDGDGDSDGDGMMVITMITKKQHHIPHRNQK